MSNIQLIIEERASTIGNFLVGRLLPFRQKRMVGPFIFLDHMGPVALKDRDRLDVLPHPHIGLSTLTYLLEGVIRHQDSLQNDLVIEPGAVNLMTAGKGIVHSERTPLEMKNYSHVLHGLQIWIALPTELEDIEPSFQHTPKDEIPSKKIGDTLVRVIAGNVLGMKSPVKTYSPLFLIEMNSVSYSEINIGNDLFGEVAMYILKGKVEIDDIEFDANQILVAKNPKLCAFKMKENSHIYIFGGDPFLEERYINWNFVSSSKNKIDEAIELWKKQKFPIIPNDAEEFVPYPTLKH